VRIKRLHLKAFGSFSEYDLNLDGPGMFNLIYGLNEAGKTTVLRSIMDLFYGIPQRSPDTYLHAPGSLRIEAVLEDAGGKEFKLARRKGMKNTLLDGDDQPLEERFLQRFLGSINREFYGLMFGMDHRSLRQGGNDLLQGQGALGEALFEAASGIGGLRELFQELDKEAGELFKPSGSRPPVNVGIERYNEMKRKVGELALAPRRWEELEETYRAEKEQVERLKEGERELLKKKARLERVGSTLPLLAQRQKNLEEMALLGDVPQLPLSFQKERLELTHQRQTAKHLQEGARKELQELQEEAAKISVKEEFLEYASDISALQERLDTYRGYVKEAPILEGEKQELQQEALSLLRRLNPALSTLEEAESLRLPLAQSEEMKHLVKEYPLLLSQSRAAKNQADEMARSLEKQRREKETMGPLRDVSALKKCLHRVRKKGDRENELSKLRSASGALEKKLQSQLNSLDLWSGTLAELLNLPLPLAETVRSFERGCKEHQDRANKLNEQISEEEQKLAAYQEQLVQLERGGDVPTGEKLEEARRYRQRGWHLVRRAWLEGRRDEADERAYGADQPLEVAYEAGVTRADEIADRLRYEANRVERKTLLTSEIKQCREKVAELNQSKEEVDKKGRELQENWVQAWVKSGISPLTPAEMLSWLVRVQEMIEGIYRLMEHQASAQDLEGEIRQDREALGLQLQALGEPGAGDHESLEMLLERVQEVSEKYLAAANRHKSIEDVCREMEENLATLRRQQDEAQKTLNAWENRWLHALRGAGLPENFTVEALSVYLDELEKLFHKKEELARRQAALGKMKEYAAGFESRLAELLEKLAPGLEPMPADLAASQLQAGATRAQQDKEKLENIEKQRQKAKATLKTATKDMEEAILGLQAMIKQARCRDEAGLPEVEEKSKRLATLKERIEGLEVQLISLGGGLSLEEIMAEAQAFSGDELPGLLEETEEALAENRQGQEKLNQAFGVTRKEYEEKITGASTAAVEAAEEAQGVLAALKLQAEEYLRLRLASIVLRRGIERYREENQSAMIKRAGELFARLTRGSFAGLKVDFDERDHPVLLGLRSPAEAGTGEEVAVQGMSDGTLDQLYLALRLVSLERYLAENEPLPFILDDLLVNFDDHRAEETLRVLGEFAGKTQVLFFTHHGAFLNLVEKTVPQSKIITLGR